MKVKLLIFPFERLSEGKNRQDEFPAKLRPGFNLHRPRIPIKNGGLLRMPAGETAAIALPLRRLNGRENGADYDNKQDGEFGRETKFHSCGILLS